MRNAQRSRKCRCWVRQDETASSGWLEQQRKLHALDLMLAVCARSAGETRPGGTIAADWNDDHDYKRAAAAAAAAAAVGVARQQHSKQAPERQNASHQQQSCGWTRPFRCPSPRTWMMGGRPSVVE
jgi:hypothetical protein